MLRLGKCAQRTGAALLLAMAASILAVPLPSQSNNPGATPQEPAAKPSEPQEPKQPATAEPKAEPAVPASTPEAGHEATREEQIASATKELYKLSAEMRAEVAKTYKDQLSLVVLRKAEQIEKLSKSLKALMDAEIADNKHK